MNPAPMAWSTWLAAHNPSRWVLQVLAVADESRETLPAPADRDIAAAVAKHCGAGDFVVTAHARQGGRAWMAERERIGLAIRQTIEPLEITIDEAQAQRAGWIDDGDDGDDGDDATADVVDAADDGAGDDPAVSAARSAARVAQAEAIAAKAQAERAAYDRQRAEAEAQARQFDRHPVEHGTGGTLVELARILESQQRAADARLERLLAALRPAPAPAGEQRKALDELKDSLALLASVRDLVQRDAPPADGDGAAAGIAAVVREIRAALPDLVQLMPKQRPGLLPPPMPAPAVDAPAPAVASFEGAKVDMATKPNATAAPLAAQRVQALVHRLASEIVASTDPAAVADDVAEDVGLLPFPVRVALDRGDWRAALAAAAPMLAPDDRQQLEQATKQPQVVQWLNQFGEAVGLDDGPATTTTTTTWT